MFDVIVIGAGPAGSTASMIDGAASIAKRVLPLYSTPPRGKLCQLLFSSPMKLSQFNLLMAQPNKSKADPSHVHQPIETLLILPIYG